MPGTSALSLITVTSGLILWIFMIVSPSGRVVGFRRARAWRGVRPPAPRPDTMRQNSMASSVSARRPRRRPPDDQKPPAGPVRVRWYGRPWRAPTRPRRRRRCTPSCSAVSDQVGAGGPGEVDPVHPRVAGEDGVDQVADRPRLRDAADDLRRGHRRLRSKPGVRLRPAAALGPTVGRQRRRARRACRSRRVLDLDAPSARRRTARRRRAGAGGLALP